jgi:hypothetical protein
MKRPATKELFKNNDEDDDNEKGQEKESSSSSFEEDSDGEREINDLNARSIGSMERGFGMSYEELHKYDGPERFSFLWWGCILLTKLEGIETAIMKIQRIFSGRFTVVDNISERTLCVKLHFEGGPIVINKGTTPCAFSIVEGSLPKDGGDWYHFQYLPDRTFVHKFLDKLRTHCGSEIGMYLVSSLYPLTLIRFDANLRKKDEEPAK